MIKFYIGGVGSGKTVSLVRDMVLNPGLQYTSNILTKHIKNNIMLKREHIMKRDITGYKKDGTPVCKYSVNVDYWKELKKVYPHIHIVIDEAHAVMNPRRSSSKMNIIITDWLALLRRVVGQDSSGQGSLTLISQADNRIDLIAREATSLLKFHRCFYTVTCKKCGYSWVECNEMPEPRYYCPACGSQKLHRHSHYIEVFSFNGIDPYLSWKFRGNKTYFDHYYITDVSDYFRFYDTMQWEALISEY